MIIVYFIWFCCTEFQEWLGKRYAEKCEFDHSLTHYKVGTLTEFYFFHTIKSYLLVLIRVLEIFANFVPICKIH